MSTDTAAAPARRRGASSAESAASERIVDTAVELFALHGLDGMSLQMLANEVGLHKSSLFHHFSGKEALKLACLERVMAPLLEVVTPLERDSASDLETMVSTVEHLADHFTANQGAALFLTRSLIAGQDEAREGRGVEPNPVPRFFTIVGGWLERARRQGSIKRIRVRHALINLVGLVLFSPSVADGFGKGLLGFDPTSARAARARREELGALVRSALQP